MAEEGFENGFEIAIVGMAGRFPGARDVAAFWRSLLEGVEAISFFSPAELLAAGEDPALVESPRYVPARGVLAGADLFDAEFFGYSPSEAELMDPQQRLFLECAWESLEDAGYVPGSVDGPVGVYGGVGTSTYVLHLLSRPDLLQRFGGFQATLTNDKDYLCTRVAYKLNLEGPAVAIQTACSTSLVAVHTACQALLNGECDMALAGGVSVSFPQQVGYLYQESGILSPDGHCRTFDARAKGSVGGAGVGIVVLKRLANARADGDSIRAVIKGSAINNDGSLKAGFTTPRLDGQVKVIRAAQIAAEIDPETITYYEAHGTATELGDPIEMAAATQAFRSRTDRRGFCAVGSVKTNVGHLGVAAGVAGLIKTVLALEYAALPPSLHFEAPNPGIDFAASPFYVNTELKPWPKGPTPRRAAVSSFGLGGTNAHVVLEEAPERPPILIRRGWQLLLLSARTEPALEQATDNLAEHLRLHPELELADVAYTSQVGRRRFQQRSVLVCRSCEEARLALESRDLRSLLTAAASGPEPPPVAFLFPGLGDHYSGMGLGLYRDEPRFREEMDRCAELMQPGLGRDVRDLLYADAGSAGEDPAPAAAGSQIDLKSMLRSRPEVPAGQARPLDRTLYAQPALFAVEHALAQLWMSWGIRPRAMMGYSLGELVAACVAGVLRLEDAVELVVRRARMIDGLPAGAMLAVPLSEAEIRGTLGESLSLAAVNGPALCVVAGLPDAAAGLERRLREDGIACRPLQTSHAFHSWMMRPVAGPFLELLRSFELQPPRIPYISNLTGTWIRDEEATDPAYWVRQMVQTVRFADGVGELCREVGGILLELGPGQSLGSLALQSGIPEQPTVLSSLRHEYDRQTDEAFLLRTLGRLWLAGAEVDWPGFHAGERCRRVPLPTYPFERQRFWIERRIERRPATAAALAEAPSGKALDVASWFHAPFWKRSPPPRGPQPRGRWLVFADGGGVGEGLAAGLRTRGCEVVEVHRGAAFERCGSGRYALDPEKPEDYDALLEATGGAPDGVVHLWSLTGGTGPSGVAAFRELQPVGFYSLLWLAQALGRRSPAKKTSVRVVADGLGAVEAGDRLQPEKATLFGPLKVIPKEHPDLRCQLIDVDLGRGAQEVVEHLLAELAQEPRDPFVAWRGAYRWVTTFEAVRLEKGAGGPVPFREGGVYLITGGLGGIGLALARHLSRQVRARLALLGRSPLPERAEWPQHRAAESDLGRRVREVEALEAAGAEVLVLQADVADEAQMRGALARVDERFGRLDGAFHLAAVPGGGLIQVKTSGGAARVLAPKAEGALVLAAVLAGRPLDFLVFFSSVAAVTGAIGQVDYCAANALLGVLAQHNQARGGVPTLAVDWGEWQWDGWSAAMTMLDPRIRSELERQRRTFGLTFDEGMEALDRALASGLPQVVVYTGDFRAALEEQRSLAEILAEMSRLAPADSGREEHPRPLLGIVYVAPESDDERQLAALWEELLGIRQVGVNDDFFELGGHSLLGLQLLSRVRDAFAVELPLRALFEAPTIAGLAATLRDSRGENVRLTTEIGQRLRRDDAREALANLDGLSEGELDRLLVQMLAERQGDPR